MSGVNSRFNEFLYNTQKSIPNNKGGKVGLINLGNSCYANAALQALFNNPFLIDFFCIRSYDSDLTVLTNSIFKLFKQVWSGKYAVIRPEDTYQCICSFHDEFKQPIQQDVVEFIEVILDNLHKELKNDLPNEKNNKFIHTSIIQDLFSGTLNNEMNCLKCNTTIHIKGMFTILSVDIPSIPESGWMKSFTNKLNLTTKEIKLESCLNSLFHIEESNEIDKLFCAKCKSIEQAVKRLQILDLPEILIIHIKRVVSSGSKLYKNNDKINFPLDKLSIRPYLHKDYKDKIGDDKITYTCNAVIEHKGDSKVGHYTSYTRHVISNEWVKYNDKFISNVSETDVLNSQATVLFYYKDNLKEKKADIEEILKSNTDPKNLCLSKQWLLKIKHLSKIYPIDNSDLECPHGCNIGIQQPCFVEKYIKISEKTWDTLYKKYTGGPKILLDSTKMECKDCNKNKILYNRKFEKEKIMQLDLLQTKSNEKEFYIISEIWLNKWRLFVSEEIDDPPGRISNQDLVDDKGEPKLNLAPVRDYRVLSKVVWNILLRNYGGGPVILRKKPDLYDK